MNHTTRFVINGRALHRRITGVERYASEVARRLKGKARIIHTRHSNGLAGHFWEQLILPLLLPEGAVLWSPANSGPLAVTRQIVTIHDLSPLEHPEWFRPAFAWFYQRLIPAIIRRVQVIIVPSRFTQSRVLSAFPEASGKVHVVPEGVDPAHFYPRSPAEIARLRRQYHLPADYILTVGTRQPRKNLSNLLSAWESVHFDHPEWNLVIAGGTGSQFRPCPTPYIPPGVRMLGYIPDEELPILYSGARAYISVALDEGFGLTVSEAMACGVPVLAARAGALPEVLGDDGLFFDPLSQPEITKQIEAFVAEPERHADCVLRATERSKEMQWGKTAQSVLGLLESV